MTNIFKVLPLIALLSTACPLSAQAQIRLFPLDQYPQQFESWRHPEKTDDQNLLDSKAQNERLHQLRSYYFDDKSPWDATFVKSILQGSLQGNLFTLEKKMIEHFSNQGKNSETMGYGENFRAYPEVWIENISNDIDWNALKTPIYQANNHAIAVDNVLVRALPTDDPHFYDHHLAGQGYPFDNLQVSAIWAGTPLYVISETKDKSFALVLSPSVIGWVHTKDLALTDHVFISMYRTLGRKNLAAITKTKTPILSQGQLLFNAYIGSIFPADKTGPDLKLYVPVKNDNDQAVLKFVSISGRNAALMPMSFSINHIKKIMHELLGRNYGWGNMYFYNDCSAEMKSFFTPFAIYLPRHSSDQVSQGKSIDLSQKSPHERLQYLAQHGKPFTTIVYIGGHVFLYTGRYVNPKTGQKEALSYQNVWGLRPADNSRRDVIGQSVLFPLMEKYPEDNEVLSPLAGKYFIIADLSVPNHDDHRFEQLFSD